MMDTFSIRDCGAATFFLTGIFGVACLHFLLAGALPLAGDLGHFRLVQSVTISRRFLVLFLRLVGYLTQSNAGQVKKNKKKEKENVSSCVEKIGEESVGLGPAEKAPGVMT